MIKPEQIHGIRLYPKADKAITGSDGSRLYVHRGFDGEKSDFEFVIGPIAEFLNGLWLESQIGLSYNQNGSFDIQYGIDSARLMPSIIYFPIQVAVYKVNELASWSRSVSPSEGACYKFYTKQPDYRNFTRKDYISYVRTVMWPLHTHSIIHMWDDVYWELFTRSKAVARSFAKYHASTGKSDVYKVDFARDYPNPTNDRLEPILP